MIIMLGVFVVGCGKERLVWGLKGVWYSCSLLGVFVCWLLGDVGGVVSYILKV